MPLTKSSKLEDQAATAALYVTRGNSGQTKKEQSYPLDANGKLSAASAATSLKYAKAQDLPAFPTVGVVDTTASAGTAAHLASANPKNIEYWKPGRIPEANKAANLAKDVKVDAIYQPEESAAGSRAALIAARDTEDVRIWTPGKTDAGQSAAGQAFRNKDLSPQKFVPSKHSEGERRALIAASGAMSGTRRRADSTPLARDSYPDATNSAANALKAATSANRESIRGKASGSTTANPQAVTNLSRDMYTSHPPVAPEVEERNRESVLRAAAVSMAKKMYEVQQRQSGEAALAETAAIKSTENRTSVESSKDRAVAQQINIHLAAQKLAAERLAKLHDENAAYRDYYGAQSSPNKRHTFLGRKRAVSVGHQQNDDSDDEEQSRQIRSQMSLFSDKLAQVDTQKREKDRQSLLEAAQRNVRASMHAQDERVFQETGKVSPAMMAQWEAKARAKAEEDSKTRMAIHGMINVGGGKFLDQSEVNAIAAAKVQPTLDQINESVERRLAKDEMLRQQQLAREQAIAEKELDGKERANRTKEEWKKFREEEKREERIRKEEVKARKAEEKKRRQEEKRKSKDHKALEKAGVTTSQTNPETIVQTPEPAAIREASSVTSSDSVSASSNGENEPSKSGQPIPVSGQPLNTESAEQTRADSTTGKPVQVQASVSTSEDSADNEQTSKPGPEPITSTPAKPVSARIAPPAVASLPLATTETTVSSGSQANRDNEQSPKKVSSWLKSKLSRHSKSGKPVSEKAKEGGDLKSTISEPRDPKIVISGAELLAGATPDTSLRDAGLAGQATGAAASSERALTGADSAGIETTSHTAVAEEQHERDSTSISSLSSDEDTRGRSAMRTADAIEQHRLQQERAKQVEAGAQVTKAGTAADSGDRILADSEPLATPAWEQEEFQEAPEQQTSVGEPNSIAKDALKAPVSSAADARQGESPARDSRFVEAL